MYKVFLVQKFQAVYGLISVQEQKFEFSKIVMSYKMFNIKFCNVSLDTTEFV